MYKGTKIRFHEVTENRCSFWIDKTPMLNNLNNVQKPDFNGDGKTDLFWRSPVTNQTAIWLMDGTQLKQSSFLVDVSSVAGWDDPEFGDFNGDGKTDLFWRNSLTGENAVWLMDGDRILAGAFIPPVKKGGTALLGDFNSDQKTDILWHVEESVSLWSMDGTTVMDTKLLQPLGAAWDNQAGDFNGDRQSDVLWRNRTNGETVIWFLNRLEEPTVKAVPIVSYGGGFQLLDLNGDGKTDLLDRNLLTGENQVWLANPSGFGEVVGLPGLSRDLVPVLGDFNGDGKKDFFLRIEGRASELWVVNGRTGLSITPLPGIEGSWVASSGDFNGDGQSDLFWQNAFTGETAIWLLSGQEIIKGEFLTPVDRDRRWLVKV
jgi:hypothetical protein